MQESEVSFFNYLDAPEELRDEWRSAIDSVLRTGRFIGGNAVTKFESDWGKYLGLDFVVGVANGFDALVLCLRALDIGPGSKVGVPAHTFLATWLAVEAVGATPIGIDCDKQGQMDLDLLFNLDSKLDAVLPVHMHGQMVAMDRLMPWATKCGVKVIEDCAQAHGADIGGVKAGCWGHAAAFSFYPTKNLGAIGDAGAVATNDKAIANKVRSISNYGSTTENKYIYENLGVNSRLDPIQASVLSVNLKYLDSWNENRRMIASRYLEMSKELKLKPLITKPESVWHHFILLSANPELSISLLRELGIGTDRHYPQSAAKNFAQVKKIQEKNFPEADKIASSTLSLPITPWMSEQSVSRVIQTLTLESVRKSFD